MCDANCIIFGVLNIDSSEIVNKKVIELGSRGVNGGLRPVIKKYLPQDYVGVDIEEGPGVDVICDADLVLDKFGKNSFDVVVTTEMLEHVRNWRKVISNMKNICKPGGVILITTRTRGFVYHGFPYDFWRFETEDMKNIFSDCIIEKIENDPVGLGVFIKVSKPNNFIENDLTKYELYSIIKNRKILDLENGDFEKFKRKYMQYTKLKHLINAPRKAFGGIVKYFFMKKNI